MQSSHKKWGKLASLGAVAVLSFSVLAACGDKADDTAKVNDDSKVLATYDGGQITEEQFNNDLKVFGFLRPDYAQYKEVSDFKNYMLDIQIEYGYLNNKATAEQKEAGTKQAEEWMKKSFGDADQKEQLQTLMDEAGVTEAQIRDYMVKSFVAAEYYESGIKDADIQKEFDANKESYVTASVRHVLIKSNGTDKTSVPTSAQVYNYMQALYTQMGEGEAYKPEKHDPTVMQEAVKYFSLTEKEVTDLYSAEAKKRAAGDNSGASAPEFVAGHSDAEALKLAKEAKAKIDGGEDFAKVAEEMSEDQGSASNGGLYENASVSQWVEAFKKAAMEQKVGVVGDPVKTDYGYHVIKVESRTDTLTDEVKENIRKNLASKKLSEFMENELAKVTKSKEEFVDEEAPAAGAGDASTGGAVTDDADKGTSTDQGAAADKSGEAGTSTETKTDGK